MITGVIAMSSVIAVILSLHIVRRSDPSLSTAAILTANLPMLLGVLIGLYFGAFGSYEHLMQMSTTPKPSDIAAYESIKAAGPILGILFSAPAWMVAIIGPLRKPKKTREE
jgi:hypothetical protein